MNTDYSSSLRKEESRFLEKMVMPFSRTWAPFCEPWEAGQEEVDRATRNGSVGRRVQSSGGLEVCDSHWHCSIITWHSEGQGHAETQGYVLMAVCVCVWVCISVLTGTWLVNLYMCARVDECLTAKSMWLSVCPWSHMFLFEAGLLWFWSISTSVSYSMYFTHLCVSMSMFVSLLAYCCYSLDLTSSSKAYVLKALCPQWCCWESCCGCRCLKSLTSLS